MKRLKLTAGVLILFSAGVLAGSLGTGLYLRHRMEMVAMGGPPPPERKAFALARLSKELDLTDAERDQIGKILEQSEEKIFYVRRMYMPEIERIVDDSFARMRETLDADRQKRLDEFQERLRRQHEQARIRSIPIEEAIEHVLSRIKERLNLTEEQARQVAPIVKTSMHQQRLVLERHEQRGWPPDMKSLRREMSEIEAALEKQLAEVLTDQQMGEFRELQKELTQIPPDRPSP
jgi:hypothetical protein